jgi:putative Mg2+ transporter-C (MgtC) family protein
MISEQEIVLRLLLGALFGGIIGFERQVHGRPAGFRTHMLVCLALVLLMVVSENYHYLILEKDDSFLRIDPARIAMGAITGVGFLGAGVIIKTGSSVQGLTTAASIWMVSAIGLAVGSGLYMASIWAFTLTLFALFVLRIVEGRMSRMSFMNLSVVAADTLTEQSIFDTLASYDARPHNIEYEKEAETGEITFRMTAALRHKTSQKDIFDAVAALAGVKKISMRRG